jgi:hypothetical protein
VTVVGTVKRGRNQRSLGCATVHLVVRHPFRDLENVDRNDPDDDDGSEAGGEEASPGL